MKISKIKIFVAIAVFVLAGGAAYYFAQNRSASPEFQRDDSGEQVSTNFNEFQEYANPKYGFSFSHSKELNVSEFSENNVDVILASSGFQILISPFDESEPITKARILKDIPDMAISDDKIISVGGEKALSFKSKGESGETLEIWFVHPVRSKSPEATADPLADRTSNGVNGYLYQISALPDSASKLENIIKTWKFQ